MLIAQEIASAVRQRRAMADQDSYDLLDTPTLTNILLNPDQTPDIHRAALSALSRRDPYQRTPRLIEILKAVLKHPERFDQDVMMGVIDILATDPDPDATYAMIELLPVMLERTLDGKDPLKPEFREYFYTALITRQREEDLDVWRDMLPRLEPRTLIAALLDPAAGPLQALEPITLMDRLEEPKRTKALISSIAGLARLKGRQEQAQQVPLLLKKTHDPAQLEDGIRALAEHWEKAKKIGRKEQATTLEGALRLIDTRPRTAAERLTGKRPWAP